MLEIELSCVAKGLRVWPWIVIAGKLHCLHVSCRSSARLVSLSLVFLPFPWSSPPCDFTGRPCFNLGSTPCSGDAIRPSWLRPGETWTLGPMEHGLMTGWWWIHHRHEDTHPGGWRLMDRWGNQSTEVRVLEPEHVMTNLQSGLGLPQIPPEPLQRHPAQKRRERP